MILAESLHPMLETMLGLERKAQALVEGFSDGKEASVLLELFAPIQDLWTTSEPYIPDSRSKGFLTRHIWFIDHFLRKDQPSLCESDARSLLYRDIPGILKSLQERTGKPIVDGLLQSRVESLILQQEYDSAIRKSFTVLKAALVERYTLSDDLDGARLINECFGGKGAARGRLSDSECEAYRNLLSGLFGLVRNKYGHNDLDADWTEAATIIAMISWVLVSLKEKG